MDRDVEEPATGLNDKEPSAGLDKEPSAESDKEPSAESDKGLSAGSDKAFTLLDPKIDLVFKAIFGNPDSPNRLLDLINAVLEAFGEPGIEGITLVNPILDPDHPEEKGIVLDICAVSDRGEPINVEMQMFDRQNWHQRSLYYWSRLYDEQLGKGRDYDQLKKTISISLLNFKLFDRQRLFSLYELKERRDHEQFSDLLQMYFIELPKSAKANKEELPPHLAGWIQFFNAKSEADLARLPKDNRALQEASEMLDEISRKPYERWLYEARRKAMLDYSNDMHEARANGQLQVLREQGTTKFGELPPWAEDKLRRATREQIQQWCKTILRADSLEAWLLEEISRKPYEHRLYEARRKAMLDYSNDMHEAWEKGEKQGRVDFLIELGASKFGKLPSWAEDKLRHATTEQIQQWGKTLLGADSLEAWLKE